MGHGNWVLLRGAVCALATGLLALGAACDDGGNSGDLGSGWMPSTGTGAVGSGGQASGGMLGSGAAGGGAGFVGGGGMGTGGVGTGGMGTGGTGTGGMGTGAMGSGGMGSGGMGTGAMGSGGMGAGGMGTGGMPADGGTRPSAGCGQANTPGGGDFSLDVDGTRRTYIVAVPDGYDPDRAYRLIFTWHYLNGSASGIARGGYYGLQSRAGGSAIFVSPEGINAAWPNTGGRDVAFARAMLTFMKDNYCVDENRIFSAGFSYGAIMSNTVGCELGDQFRAIAPMSGSGPRARACVGQVAAWLSHGTSDGTVSFSSGQGSRDHWVAANHCDGQTTDLGDCVAYQGCDDGYPVHWCQFSGGHTRPNFAPDAIWAFFEQF